jgi:ribonucleotide reductase alpha subunit
VAKKKLEEYLAPWEVDDKGEKLEEPQDIDPVKLKKYLLNLLNDKDDLQERVKDIEVERENAKADLDTLRREHEDEGQRRQREEKEREERYIEMERRETERRKIEAIEDHFKDQGITSARAKRLAKRITATEENEWLSEADELVEDGFRVTDGVVETQSSESEESNDFLVRPVVRRSDGKIPPTLAKPQFKSVAEELEAGGVFAKGGW